jgi:hypothetical protein
MSEVKYVSNIYMPDANVPTTPPSETGCLVFEIKYAECIKRAFLAGPDVDCASLFKSFAECNKQHVTNHK